MIDKCVKYKPELNTMRTRELDSWFFYPGEVDGIRVMVAVRIFDLKSAIGKCEGNKDAIALMYHNVNTACNKFMFEDKVAYGSVCAYVECTMEQAQEDNAYANGGYSYCTVDEVTKKYNDYRHVFPDGTKATEGKVIVGWDYNHSWNKDSDKEEAEHDIYKFCCKLLGEESTNKITAYKPSD